MSQVFYAGVWLVSFAVIFAALSALLNGFRKLKRRNNKELWMRAGVTLSLTDAEVAAIFGGGDLDEIVRGALEDGRFEWDGEAYIPDDAVEQFNERYGTDYPCGDYEVVL